MEANEEGEETSSHGNDWEVVSLTASVYAAAPGSEQVELNDNDECNMFQEVGSETSRVLFMSGHFVFPPRQHENIALEPEIIDAQGDKKVVTELGSEGGHGSKAKDKDNWDIKGFPGQDVFPGIEFFDENNILSIHGKEFEEQIILEGLNLVDKDQCVYSATKFGSFHSDTTTDGSPTCDEMIPMSPDPIELSDEGLDLSISKLLDSRKKDICDEPDLPCEAWWKRRVASFYAHAKDANTCWSIFVAAAVMGLIYIGQQWQKERWQVLQLKWQICINDEKMGKMLGSMFRFRDIIAGGSQPSSDIWGSSSTEH